MPAHFEDLQIGTVESLGAAVVDAGQLDAFIKAYAPGWLAEQGAPAAMVYARGGGLEQEAARPWPQLKRLGVDALRWVRNPPAGELLRGRMTVMGKDPV